MSEQTVEEKTAAPAKTEGKKARATLAQLAARWGFDAEESGQVRIFVMGRQEVWYRISGSGKTAVYEREEL